MSCRKFSPPQSLMLKGGLARMKSALRSGCKSARKLSALRGPRLASMPRMARFIRASFQVVVLAHGHPFRRALQFDFAHRKVSPTRPPVAGGPAADAAEPTPANEV